MDAKLPKKPNHPRCVEVEQPPTTRYYTTHSPFGFDMMGVGTQGQIFHLLSWAAAWCAPARTESTRGDRRARSRHGHGATGNAHRARRHRGEWLPWLTRSVPAHAFGVLQIICIIFRRGCIRYTKVEITKYVLPVVDALSGSYNTGAVVRIKVAHGTLGFNDRRCRVV